MPFFRRAANGSRPGTFRRVLSIISVGSWFLPGRKEGRHVLAATKNGRRGPHPCTKIWIPCTDNCACYQMPTRRGILSDNLVGGEFRRTRLQILRRVIGKSTFCGWSLSVGLKGSPSAEPMQSTAQNNGHTPIPPGSGEGESFSPLMYLQPECQQKPKSDDWKRLGYR